MDEGVREYLVGLQRYFRQTVSDLEDVDTDDVEIIGGIQYNLGCIIQELNVFLNNNPPKQ